VDGRAQHLAEFVQDRDLVRPARQLVHLALQDFFLLSFLLGPSLLGDIPEDRREPDASSGTVPDGEGGEPDIDQGPILPHRPGFVPDLLLTYEPFQVPLHLARLSRSLEKAAGSAENLRRGEPEQPLGGGIPAGDEPIQICAHDGVVGGSHDGNEPRHGLLPLLAIGDVRGNQRHTLCLGHRQSVERTSGRHQSAVCGSQSHFTFAGPRDPLVHQDLAPFLICGRDELVNRAADHGLQRHPHHPGKALIRIENGPVSLQGHGPLIHLLNENTVRPFGARQREDPVTLRRRDHRGIDLTAADGPERLLRFSQACAKRIHLGQRLFPRLRLLPGLAHGSIPAVRLALTALFARPYTQPIQNSICV
jgi:hypothetical protein